VLILAESKLVVGRLLGKLGAFCVRRGNPAVVRGRWLTAWVSAKGETGRFKAIRLPALAPPKIEPH
ncbi:MAG TPA: hypothetical protein PLD90_02810, partial [Rhodocyclaceae bacterium]|nr:hypothetical protein [Rhodocyclaceae bacterium]